MKILYLEIWMFISWVIGLFFGAYFILNNKVASLIAYIYLVTISFIIYYIIKLIWGGKNEE